VGCLRRGWFESGVVTLAIATALCGTVARAQQQSAPRETGTANRPRVDLTIPRTYVDAPSASEDTRATGGGERQTAYLRERQLEGDVAAGQVDSWYYDLRRGYLHTWRPSPSVLDHSGPTGGDAVLGVASTVAALVLRSAAGGAASAPSTSVTREVPDELLAPPPQVGMPTGPTLAERRAADARAPSNAPVVWHAVEVRVVQRTNGALVSVAVRHSSGLPALDRAAVQAVRRALRGRLPPAPARVAGHRTQLVSDWSFELGDVVVQSPRLEQGFDGSVSLHADMQCMEAAGDVGGWQCTGPFGRLVRTRIRLLRVDDALRDTRRAAEHRSVAPAR